MEARSPTVAPPNGEYNCKYQFKLLNTLRARSKGAMAARLH
jgi:hypothetical protein